MFPDVPMIPFCDRTRPARADPSPPTFEVPPS
jgi:hypothetical protein